MVTSNTTIKVNLNYTHGITPKRVKSGGAHLRSLAPGQHSSGESSQRWRAVGDTVSNLKVPGFEPQTSRTDSNVLITELTGWYHPLSQPHDEEPGMNESGFATDVNLLLFT